MKPRPSSSVRFAGAELVFLRDSVIKNVDGRAGDDEALLTQAAHELGARCGLFYVPRVLRRERESGAIELQRISGPTPLSKIPAHELEDDLIARAGAALAHIHQHLRPPAGLECRDVLEWPCREEDWVLLHGDFNTINVCRDAGGRLVILDWSSAPALGGRRLYGSRYFDIAHFIVSLAAHRRNVLEAMRRFPARAITFLRAYAGQSAVELDPDRARAYVLGVSELLRRRPARSGRLYASYYKLRRAFVHRALDAATADWLRTSQPTDNELGRQWHRCAGSSNGAEE